MSNVDRLGFESGMSRLAGVKRQLKMRCSRAASSRPSDRRLNAEEVDRYNFCLACPPDVSGVLRSKRTCIEQDHETPDESAGRSEHAPFENKAMVAASTDARYHTHVADASVKKA